MNAFCEHHKNHIRFDYACFDRILLNGLIQPFQQPERVIGFFNTYRHQFPVSRKVLTDIADQFHGWVKNRSETWHAPIMEAPEGRRDEFVEPYFHQAKPDQIVAIVKAPRASTDHGRHRQQQGKSQAFANRPAVGGSLQLLRERCPLGKDVRAHVSLPSVLSSRVPESAPLVGR